MKNLVLLMSLMMASSAMADQLGKVDLACGGLASVTERNATQSLLRIYKDEDGKCQTFQVISVDGTPYFGGSFTENMMEFIVENKKVVGNLKIITNQEQQKAVVMAVAPSTRGQNEDTAVYGPTSDVRDTRDHGGYRSERERYYAEKRADRNFGRAVRVGTEIGKGFGDAVGKGEH